MSQSNLTPTRGSRPRRFNGHLAGLKKEFDLMAQEIESLEKERDEYKTKGMHFVLLSCECFTKLLLCQLRRKRRNFWRCAARSIVSDVERETRALLKLPPRLG
jgi:hypothetical protein